MLQRPREVRVEVAIRKEPIGSHAYAMPYMIKFSRIIKNYQILTLNMHFAICIPYHIIPYPGTVVP
jgi:hypothetical protein